MMTDLLLFTTIATAIMLEAAPFLLLGSLVGALLEAYLPRERLHRLIPRNTVGQVAVGVCCGMALPTCECGVVPVARRLLLKGAPPAMALPYMMAAPVVNPIVLISTWVAFQGDWAMVGMRVLLVAVSAVAVGLAMGGLRPYQVLAGGALAMQSDAQDHGCGCGPDCGHDHHETVGRPRWLVIAVHAFTEFMSMFRFLALGAVAAAAVKTFTPAAFIEAFAASTPLAVGGMMLFAILLSICSEADAFVAASFASFPDVAQVAFTAIGPMVDLKLIPLFFLVFHRRIAWTLIIVPCVLVYGLATLLGMLP